MGSDSSLGGDPRLGVRAGGAVGPAVRLGADLSVWLPGGDAPSVVLDAASLELRGLASFALGDSITLALDVGYRLDNSAQSVTTPGQLRSGDWTSLGLSNFDAVVFGAGVDWRGETVEVFGELSGDVFLGTGGADAPPIVRGGAGGRLHLSPSLSLELAIEA